MADTPRPLRILVAAPVYWPATAFGGPISVMRELVRGLSERGHEVDVVTSSLASLELRGRRRTSMRSGDGARIHYAATPMRFRWMGVTPTLPVVLRRLPRPDVAHIFGFRDPVGTFTAAWCARRGVPYAFEALGMFAPKLRKVALKRTLDASLYRHVPAGAALAIAASGREREEYRAGGIPDELIAIRPNGFPPPQPGVGRPGPLRARLGLAADAPLVLSVGRLAAGKGLELLAEAGAGLPGATIAVVGPDDGHGVEARLRPFAGNRFRLLGPAPADVLPSYYADADVFVLDSAHENFGLVAAEAAAAGTASIVSDRCGIAELVGGRAALVVPYGDVGALRAALDRLLDDGDLRRRLGDGGREVAEELGWPRVVELQESLYRRLLE